MGSGPLFKVGRQGIGKGTPNRRGKRGGGLDHLTAREPSRSGGCGGMCTSGIGKIRTDVGITSPKILVRTPYRYNLERKRKIRRWTEIGVGKAATEETA